MPKTLLFSVTKKDFREDHFRSGGKGGQNQNKRETGVRFTHLESGAVGECREERSQLANRKRAFKRCVESSKFQTWAKIKASEEMGIQASIKEKVEKELERVKVEIVDPKTGKWIEEESCSN